MNVTKLSTGLLIVSGLLPFLLSAVTLEKKSEKRYPAENRKTLHIETNEGGVFLQGWDEPEVYIVMSMRTWGHSEMEAQNSLDEMRVEILPQKEIFLIKEKNIKKESFNFFDVFDREYWDEKRWRNSVVDFEIMIPRTWSVHIVSDEGDVDMEQIEGDIDVRVDEGNIVMKHSPSKRIQLLCDEGDVRLEELNQPDCQASIQVDEGNVFVDFCNFDILKAYTDEGDVIIRQGVFQKGDFKTDEGDIEVELMPKDEGRYRMMSDEGDILLTLAQEASLCLKLKTDKGRIASDFSLHYRRLEEGEMLEGQLGECKALLKGFTSEGDIDLKRMLPPD